MCKSWFFILAFLVLMRPIHAQNKLNQLKDSLTAKAVHFKQCLLGEMSCSKEEIRNARWNLGLIIAILSLIAHHKGWGQKIIRDITRLAKKADNLPQNPDPKKQQEIEQELHAIIEQSIQKLPIDAQKEVKIVMQQSESVPSTPASSTITVPDDPVEQIKKQLATLYGALEIFLQNPHNITLASFKEIYKSYLTTIATHRDIKIDTLLAQTIENTPYTGNTLLEKVRDTIKQGPQIIQKALIPQIQKAAAEKGYESKVVYGKDVNPALEAYNKALKDYQQNQSDENLLAFHFALLDVGKIIYPMSLEKYFSQIPNFPTPDFSEVDKTEQRFLQLLINKPALITKLQQYPGYQTVTKKSLQQQFKKTKKKKK